MNAPTANAPVPHTDAGSELDLSVCDAEPIHSPGAIQPHGALLAALADSLTVTHASANLLAILGRPAEAVLGHPLHEAIGEAACAALFSAEAGGGQASPQIHTMLGPTDQTLHLRAHRFSYYRCVDILPGRSQPEQTSPVTKVQEVLETFKRATTRQELCERAVRGLQAISGFDRVMAYRFDAEGSGEIIAEVRTPHLEPFLGLRYPAGDVPRPARLLSLRNPVAATPDFNYQPVALLREPALDDDIPLDLTHSHLRSISPYHRQYMRNMNVGAALTVALIHQAGQGEPELWGSLLCHNTTPRPIDLDLRAVAATIGQVVSLLLRSLGEAEIFARRIKRYRTLRTLVERLAPHLPLPDALTGAEADLLHLVDAAGAAIRWSGKFLPVGQTPPPEASEQIMAALLEESDGKIVEMDNLGHRHPAFAPHASTAAGVLLLPLGKTSGDVILWFRPELAQVVTWGGDPAEHVIVDPDTGRLSPRNSFAAWKETVRGRSAPWTDADLSLARDLGGSLEAATAERTKTELFELRYYDPLTGLPNRSLLQERLAQAERDPSSSAILLFIDLDHTKAINDTMGYAAGDAVLAEVARRLRNAAPEPHFAARLGGAEFVVLCRGLDRSAAAGLGERIRHAIEAPFEIGGKPCNVAARIGIAIVDQSGSLDPGRATDMAMYSAMSNTGAKRKAEAQRQKMEALGRMMGGVAHEINNMLQPVTLLAQDLIDSRLVTEEGTLHLTTIVDCNLKARQIIGDLLAFSRPDQRIQETHDPVALLDESLRLVRKAVPASLAVTVQVEGEPPPITINRTTFVQIMLNLATNASAAMKGQGELKIVLEDAMPGRDESDTRPFARISVIDTGCGMDKTTLERAFEPFFTTKPVGEGTGLGLPVVYAMVHEFGGTISLDSQLGRGTTVTILIPGQTRKE